MKKIGATVVVIIVAVAVVGVCISGIQKTHLAAGRTQCTNNLKQIGLALHGYHDGHKRLPRALAASPTADLPPEKQVSWLYMISPYVEAHMDPKFQADTKKPWDDAENEYVATKPWAVYQCPTPPNRGEKYPFAHYVGMTGIGKDAAWLPFKDPKAGMFGYERKLTIDDVTDGTSTTIMVTETGKDNGPWAQGGFATARGIDRQESDYLGADGQFLSYHRNSNWFYFKSWTLVTMADASVRGLTNRVSDDVLEALATYAGGEKVRAEDLDR